MGFRGVGSASESTCQCRSCRFNPWVGKIPWKRKWQPIPIFLRGKFHGQRSLAGYSPEDRRESNTTLGTEHACMAHYSTNPDLVKIFEVFAMLKTLLFSLGVGVGFRDKTLSLLSLPSVLIRNSC